MNSSLIQSQAAAEDPFGEDDLPARASNSRGILVRVPLDVRKRLKHLALDQNTTLQALMVEAINDLLIKLEAIPPGPKPLSD